MLNLFREIILGREEMVSDEVAHGNYFQLLAVNYLCLQYRLSWSLEHHFSWVSESDDIKECLRHLWSQLTCFATSLASFSVKRTWFLIFSKSSPPSISSITINIRALIKTKKKQPLEYKQYPCFLHSFLSLPSLSPSVLGAIWYRGGEIKVLQKMR